MLSKREPWRNRIVSTGEANPEDLLASSRNWRVHGHAQEEILGDVLAEVGIVQSVIVNKRMGEDWPEGERNVETLVDGHLRVELAMRKGQRRIPVTYVDLTPAEEAEVLATLDPIAGLAERDQSVLDDLLANVQTESAAVAGLLDGLASRQPAHNEDRTLEEIDLASLPEKPVWALCAIPVDLLPEVKPLLDQIELAGVRVEVSDG